MFSNQVFDTGNINKKIKYLLHAADNSNNIVKDISC